MYRRVRFVSAVAIALLAGCGTSSTSSPNSLPTAVLGVTASPVSVIANGTNTVSVTVTGSTSGAITASTSKGLFSNGQKAIQAPSTPVTFTLVTCDAATDAGCPGTAVVRAVDASGVAGQADVTFTSAGGGVVCTTCGAAACVGVVCDGSGHTCSSSSPSTCSTCPAGDVEICNDGKDNNCNGLVDCADPQCQPVGNEPGAFCDLVGHTCSVNNAPGPSACTTCSGNGGTPQQTESSCGDGFDNDCNGLTDCQDPACAGAPCKFGLTCDGVAKTCSVQSPTCTGCGQPECSGMTCDANGHTCAATAPYACTTCPGGTQEICNDGKDNNCNGLVDCADPQCQPVGNAAGALCDAVGHTCSVNGAPGPSTCTTCSGNGGVPQTTETSCGDGFDNDCNGFADCQDPACSGKPCSFGFTCDATRKTCTTPSTTCAACGDPACVGMICDTSTGLTCSAGPPSTCTTCPAGTFTCADPAKVSLVLVAADTRIPAVDGAETTITATLTLDGSPVTGQSISFAVSPAGMGTIVTAPVRATDSNGQTTVRFRSNGDGGSATITGTIVINPTANATGSTTVTMPFLGRVTFVSAQYEVLGAKYSDFQERSTVTYQVFDSLNQPYPAGLPVVFTHESLVGSYIGDLPLNCTGTPSICTANGVTDANGQAIVGVSSGTAAGEILIEAGASAANTSKQGEAHRLAITGARANGARMTMNCYFGLEVENVKNIPALSNTNCTNSLYVHPTIDAIRCRVALADRFNNVVGRSTRIQYFSEAGTAGTSFLTPPYDATVGADAQVDLGVGIGLIRPDGQLPADVAPFGGEVFRSYDDGCNHATHNPRDGLVTIMAMARGDEGFVDLNGNGTHDPGEPFIDIGEPYVDANDNGVHDVGEYFVDVNGNGVWDGPNGQWDYDTVIWMESRVLFTGLPSLFAPGVTGSYATAGFFDPVTMAPAAPFSVASSVPGPASTQDVYVAFGDGNFNPPVAGSSLAVSMTGGNATAAFVSNPNQTGHLGLSFTQMYCPQETLEEVTDITQCSSVCTTSPCYVVTNVGNCTPGTNPRSDCSGLGFGTTGLVRITGGTPAGSNTLTVTGTPAGGTPVTTTLSGTVTP